jgi:nitroimidazol reductase NimA-like FMN-containing flavoprotein (pyridoxamine 5'-phosphate oxidase superfamily)
MADADAPSSRTTVRRHAERGRYDREVIDAILDEGLICHLGVVVDGRPHVIPTMYARRGNRLFIHGAMANRALIALRKGSQASLVVTILDGLVMARSAFNHSMNYRSVVVLGQAVEVVDEAEKLAAMEALVEQVASGRWAQTRRPNPNEMKSTVILAMTLDEASAKVRSGPPIDDEADLGSEFWAGVIPLGLAAADPIDAPDMPQPVEVPGYARAYRRGPGTAT